MKIVFEATNDERTQLVKDVRALTESVIAGNPDMLHGIKLETILSCAELGAINLIGYMDVINKNKGVIK